MGLPMLTSCRSSRLTSAIVEYVVHSDGPYKLTTRETLFSALPDGREMAFYATYTDIVPDQRIVYTSTLSTETDLWTVSLTTVEFTPGEDGGTRLVLTEQGAYLDGHEQPAWREHGTSDQLEALAAQLKADG